MRGSRSTEDASVKFEDVSLEVKIERRERSFSCGEPRMRPLAAGDDQKAGPAVFSAQGVNKRQGAIKSSLSDVTAIRQLIEEYERLPPDQVQQSLGRLTTSPYTSIANGIAMVVDDAAMKKWASSSYFTEALTAYNKARNSVSDVSIEEINVLLIDERTGSVQYRTREVVSGGATAYGSSAAVVVKGDDDTWRIAVVCEHPLTAF
jgi:hypothetical protein